MFSWMRKSRDGHKMASSYQIPWAYRAATEPTSVSHDRETGPANDLTRTAGVRPGPPGAQEHSHGDGPLLKVVCVWYRSHNIIRHGPHTCRRTTRTALDEAIIPVVICQQSTIATKWLTRTLPLKIDLLTLKSWRWFSVPQGTALGGACPWSLLENQYETHKNIDVETCRLRPVTSQCTNGGSLQQHVCEPVLSNETFGYIGCQGQTSAHCHRR